MALFTEQFFADHLTLPYPEAAVVGHAYYAAPAPDLPLRLRIDFAPTIYADRYDGLRLRIVHLDKGPIDTAVLRFADHGAFDTRDRRLGHKPGQGEYGTFNDWNHSEHPPWVGIGVTRLRAAIDQYVRLWIPGAPPVRTSQPPAAAARQVRTSAARAR
ncbi:hypothetical protein ACFY7Y_32515 [Streptomyces virginiae]|uniref:hypothetical protein n=1 Tax=Streptomyces TaxID=1883 RepID=UPI002E10FA5F|nr:hypothetical protein OG444_32315 [Streptomyces sp. NBC_01232]